MIQWSGNLNKKNYQLFERVIRQIFKRNIFKNSSKQKKNSTKSQETLTPIFVKAFPLLLHFPNNEIKKTLFFQQLLKNQMRIFKGHSMNHQFIKVISIQLENIYIGLLYFNTINLRAKSLNYNANYVFWTLTLHFIWYVIWSKKGIFLL